MLWIDHLVIRWLLWRKKNAVAAAYARKVIETLRAGTEVECSRLAAAAGIDVPVEKETRIIRASGDVFKIGQRVRIDNRDFTVTRLLSASKREVIYEVVG